MSPLNLIEVDSLEAHVLIDNELDPMSTIAPDTVQVSGLMGHLAMGSPHNLDDRGDANKELRMEDLCCSAHGLSILLVRIVLAIRYARLADPADPADRNKRRQEAFNSFRCGPGRRCMGEERPTDAAGSFLRGAGSTVPLASGPFR